MIRKEAGVFLIVGSLTVVVDYICYQLLLWLGMVTPPAKGIAFVAGTLFAYVANRKWTFSHRPTVAGSVHRFVVLYSTTLLVNVGVNNVVLALTDNYSWAIQVAFLLATVVSATLNFLGMKFYVFFEACEGNMVK